MGVSWSKRDGELRTCRCAHVEFSGQEGCGAPPGQQGSRSLHECHAETARVFRSVAAASTRLLVITTSMSTLEVQVDSRVGVASGVAISVRAFRWGPDVWAEERFMTAQCGVNHEGLRKRRLCIGKFCPMWLKVLASLLRVQKDS